MVHGRQPFRDAAFTVSTTESFTSSLEGCGLLHEEKMKKPIIPIITSGNIFLKASSIANTYQFACEFAQFYQNGKSKIK